jgi:release factor glutamine methyltransferase
MLSYKDAISHGSDVLNTPTPHIDTKVILKHITGKDDLYLLLNPNEMLSNEEEDIFLRMIELRKKSMPVAYIIGKKEFMGLEFKVDKRCLIPRPDTEILVNELIKKMNGYEKVLDIGTGSGAIILSLKNNFSGISAHATDISPSTIEIAKENSLALNCEVFFHLTNLFPNSETNFDVIVSNPPYIDLEQMKGLMKDVKDYEPDLALFGGIDGLDYYRKIIQQSIDFLTHSGILAFEIGFDQAPYVLDLMHSYGFKDLEVFKDYSGHDRVIIGHKE